MNYLNFGILLLFFLFFIPVSSEGYHYNGSHLPVESDFSDVDSVVYKGIIDSIYPGGVLVIGNGKGIIYKKAYGGYDYSESAIRYQAETIFDLASVTKVLATTLATMKLYEQGKIDLSVPVAKYIPDFAQNGKDSVLIRNLLLHNSGFQPGRPFHQFCSKSVEVYDSLYATPLVYGTGSGYVYSDLNFITLGKIVEVVSGETLDRFCFDNFYEPMGLQHTMFNPPDSLWLMIAPTEVDFNYYLTRRPGTVRNQITRLLNGVAGHAGLFSSAVDIAQLAIMLINYGNYRGERILNKPTVELFTQSYSVESTRGLGWDTGNGAEEHRVGNTFSSSAYGHTGYTGTSLWIDPERDIFIVFLTNRTYGGHIDGRIYTFRPLLHDTIIRIMDEFQK